MCRWLEVRGHAQDNQRGDSVVMVNPCLLPGAAGRPAHARGARHSDGSSRAVVRGVGVDGQRLTR
jgi:hypothetical protein